MITEPEWNTQGAYLVKGYQFKDFVSAINFINQVADLAEDHDHHPDIFLHDYDQVEVRLTTHQDERVTDKDIKLAADIDKIKLV